MSVPNKLQCSLDAATSSSSSSGKSRECIHSVRWTQDGTFAMTCSEGREIYLWNPHKSSSSSSSCAPSGLLVKTYKGVHGYGVRDVAITGDKDRFISVGADRTAFIWDVSTGSIIRRIQSHNQRTNCIALNKNDSVFVTGSEDGSAKLWDLRSNSRDALQVLNDFKDSVTSVVFTDDTIMGGCIDGCVYTYDIRKGQLIRDKHSDSVTCVSVSKDGKCSLSSCLGDILELNEISNGKLLQVYKGHTHTNYAITSCFSYDDSVVLSGSEDGSIFAWDIVSGEARLQLINAHSQYVTSIAYHPTASMFISAAFDGSVYCWRP